MIDIIVFCGPTITPGRVRELLPGADIRGPAACGDVLRAALAAPHAIGVVDGFFDHRLSVWHKELLWAISQGIAVYGASSMGALRAAELGAFGMVGVGEIFRAFADRAFEDDDEVAVTHEAADREYRPLSEAMVNLRATLAAATREGLLSARCADMLTADLKARFYPERDRRALLDAARALLPATEATALSAWVARNGIVNQKLLDAEAMLRRMADDAGARRFPAPPPAGEFPHTNAWQALLESVRDGSETGAPAEPPGEAALAATLAATRRLLEELRRRDSASFEHVWHLARERAFAVSLASSRGLRPDAAGVQREADRFRRELDLLTPAETARWLSENDLDVEGFSRMVSDTTLVHDLEPAMIEAIESQVPNVLRMLGAYAR